MTSIIIHPLANRNVKDCLKSVSDSDIKNRVGRKNFAIATFPTKQGGNTAAILRTFSLFNGIEFITIGRKKFNPIAAVGAQYYEHITHCKDENEFYKLVDLRSYNPICVDKTDKSTDITNNDWPLKPLFIFGREADGIPSEVLAKYGTHKHITMYGPLRSFNVVVAAGIVMHQYIQSSQI